MLEIKEIYIKGFHKVIEGIDPDAGLHCFIAIHDTTLGPSLGGTRIFPYSTREDALNDALRLAKAMTYKSAIAQDGMGGGKSVIIANPMKDKSEKLLLAFGNVVHQLKGEYIAAEDVGSCMEDMSIIRRKTPYVAALPTDKSSGDPSRYTAWGVFRGIQAVSYRLWNTTCLKGRKILVQGLGNVGSKVANLLFWEGADLILSEVNLQRLHEQTILYGAEIADPNTLYSTKCDIFTPCAMGGIINSRSLPQLKCKAVAGGANNQLECEEMGDLLKERGILYAPDFIINSGGIINATAEFEPGGYNPKNSRDKVNHIYETLLQLFEKSAKENMPTHKTAEQIAEHNLKYQIGKRTAPIEFR